MKVRYTFTVWIECEEDPQDLPIRQPDKTRLERLIIRTLEPLRLGSVDAECMTVETLEDEQRAHRAADPHCTCNDCIDDHQRQVADIDHEQPT